MPADTDRIMFEVYRGTGCKTDYRVVYFTELGDTERDREIDAAMSGEHFFGGFITAADAPFAKHIIHAFTQGLNDGAAATKEDLVRLLGPCLVR